MATAAQSPEPEQPASLPASAPLEDCLASPSPLDHRIYHANRAGQSITDIAKSKGVTEEEITAAIVRVRVDNERYSATAAGVEARKLFFAALPKIASALDAALTATKLHGKKVVMVDKETGEQVTMEDFVERPDHDIRLRAIDTSRFILAVVQPKDPAVVINSNSQTNILNQAPQSTGQLGQGGLTSPEAVIRAIQAQRAQLTDGKAAAGQPVTIEAAANEPAEEILEEDDDDDDEDDDLDEDDDDNPVGDVEEGS